MEIFRTLGALVEPPAPEHVRLAEALELGEPAGEVAYTDLFAFQLYPYASVYLGAEGMLGGEARDRIAGFWRALGQTPPTEPDHLAVMLALHAGLGEWEAEAADPASRERWHHARKAFFWEHLASWLPFYLGRLVEVAPPFYRRWGKLLERVLCAEAIRLGPPELLSLHLRQAPPLTDPRSEGADALLVSLLAPVRSGLILLRDDLSAAAEKLGLGARVGERKFVLKALLGQDAPATLGWLAAEAERQARAHADLGEDFGKTASFWRERAERTAVLLEELVVTSSTSLS